MLMKLAAHYIILLAFRGSVLMAAMCETFPVVQLDVRLHDIFRYVELINRLSVGVYAKKRACDVIITQC